MNQKNIRLFQISIIISHLKTVTIKLECGCINCLTSYGDKIYVDIKGPYYNKIFSVKCLIEYDPEASIANTFFL